MAVREFDMATCQFVADGFSLPAGRHNVGWLDQDTLLVSTDFGDGSLTDMGLVHGEILAVPTTSGSRAGTAARPTPRRPPSTWR